jgi:hypothetical protein
MCSRRSASQPVGTQTSRNCCIWRVIRLDLLPQRVDQSSPAAGTVREVYDGLWKVAKAVNELRNAEGTGHGRTAVPTVSPETARVVVQAAGLLSALLLDTLDTRYGGRRSATA